MFKHLLILFSFLLSFHPALSFAKRDFYVKSEVRCTPDNFCITKKDQIPLNGKLRIYYASGFTKSETHFINGKRNGLHLEFYPDGKQSVYEVYLNGVRNGGASLYYNNGNIKAEVHYVLGILDGNYKEFYEDGAIKTEGAYLNGKKNGRERTYSQRGKVINEITYMEGSPSNAVCHDINGNRINYTLDATKYIALKTTPCERKF